MLDQFVNFPLNIGIEAPLILLVLVALEAVLSADNAIALATIAQGLDDDQLQGQALNLGLGFAYVLRMLLILTATWVIQFWQFELLGAIYLLWLVLQYFASSGNGEDERRGPRFNTIWQAIPMIALTDLAFSLDSVTTAIAVSKQTWLILTGATIGIIALRFMAGLFIRWLDEYVHLKTAGYLTVAVVGLRMLIRVFNEDILPPEGILVASIALLFIWGFSQKKTKE